MANTTFAKALKEQRVKLDDLLRDLAAAAARVQGIQRSEIYSDDYKREQEQKALKAALDSVAGRVAAIRLSQQAAHKKLAAELAGPEPSWSERAYHHQRAAGLIAGKSLTQIMDVYMRLPSGETGLRREIESMVDLEHGSDRDWQALRATAAPVELKAADAWESRSAAILASIEQIATGADRPVKAASLKSLLDAAEMLASCSTAWDRFADESLAMMEGREPAARTEARAAAEAQLAAADAAKAGDSTQAPPAADDAPQTTAQEVVA